jgi:hypothetical protein
LDLWAAFNLSEEVSPIKKAYHVDRLFFISIH